MKYSDYMSDTFKEYVLHPYLLKCRAARTADEYVGYLRILCDTVGKDFLDITEDDAELVFQKWHSKGLARRTIRTRLSCYNSVADFIKNDIEQDLDYFNPFENIVRPDVCDDIKPQKIPSLVELDAIMSQASSEPMWYLILALVSRACLSPSKITQITSSSIFRDEGKTGLYFKDKSMVILPDDVAVLFENYVETVTEQDDVCHIFYNKHGRALTLKNIDTKVSDIIEKSGIEEHYTLINIRSRAILELAKAGVDEATIARYANIGAMRTRQFIEAKSLIGDCPANLVNYRLCC